MSKSLGNFYTKADIENRGFDLLDLRYLYLNTHYRTTMNFTWRSISGAKRALGRLKARLEEIPNPKSQIQKYGNRSKLEGYRNRFTEAVNNDLNIPKALSILWKVIDDNNLWPQDKYNLILEFDKVFGLDLGKPAKLGKIPQNILELIREREDLRREKKWQEADGMRRKIQQQGYEVEDTEQGQKIRPAK